MGYKTYFISGHGSITDDEWEVYYKESINNIIASEKNPMFVVGDYKGVDSKAQDYLKKKNARCIVFHMLDTPRYNAGFPTIGGFGTDEDRDAAMTKVSDIDLLYVRDPNKKSGTGRNFERRREYTNKIPSGQDLIRSEYE